MRLLLFIPNFKKVAQYFVAYTSWPLGSVGIESSEDYVGFVVSFTNWSRDCSRQSYQICLQNYFRLQCNC